MTLPPITSRWLAALLLVLCGVPTSASQVPGVGAQTPVELHLVLDLSVPRLRLIQGGALLREYRVDAVEVGRPATLFLPRRATWPAGDRIWKLETLDPERRFNRPIILPAAPGSSTETVAIPPPPEEAVPAPGRYLLRFAGGLAIEIVGDGPERDPVWRVWPRSARWHLRELGQSVAWRPPARLRLVMPDAEAGALYRSLPPALSLIVRQGENGHDQG